MHARVFRVIAIVFLLAVPPTHSGALRAQEIDPGAAEEGAPVSGGIGTRGAAAEAPRFPGRTIVVGAGGGAVSYLGDFDGGIGFHTALTLGYAVYPELTVLLTADIARAAVMRDPAQTDPLLYEFQYLRGTGESTAERTINLLGFDIATRLNLFPYRYYNIFFSLGIGLTFYKAEDFAEVRIRPAADFPAAITVPVGVGGEWYLGRNLALSLQLRNAFLFRDDIDAFDPEELAMEYNRRGSNRIAVPSSGGDNVLSFTVGIQYALFESFDYDGDLLENAEEDTLGTDPYEIDTDIDGLTDFEEVRVHTTNPLKPDTDDDGLGDYFEITKYGSNPLRPDTDDDRLSDLDETAIYNTDPRKPDTDDDLLSDYEEVIRYETNPRNPDTDYDGLDDFAEVKVHETNPRRPDTDDDGIYDFNEVVTYKTNPRKPDTDSDHLLDYDEIAYYGTSPLNADTDGDTIDDATEVYDMRTNPLDQDPARGIDRKSFAERPQYNAELLETRPLPEGGTSYLIAPAVTRRLPRAPESLDSVVAALAAVDSSIKGVPGESSAEAYARYRRRTVQHIVPAEDRAASARPIRLDSLRLRVGDIISFCNITFEFDRDELREEYIPILREAAALFGRYPGMRVEIRGHTDADGEEGYNQRLSERRALAVRDFLVTNGVQAGRLRSVGFGEHRPIAVSDTNEGRARNRRVEFFIDALEPRSSGVR